jgi:uncharacterized protein YbaA (DUF1428 family)
MFATSKETAMGYVEGFVIPVAAANEAAYRASGNDMTSRLKRLGATRVVECWNNDLGRTVAGRGGSNVVMGWVEWPSKEARDRASRR